MAKAKKEKKSKATELADVGVVAALAFDMSAMMDEQLDQIEKKTKISSQSMMRHAERVSTGALALDMYLDGGIVPGGWYTFSGGEQSCKSTMTMSIMATLIKLAYSGIAAVFDFEGSTDADYVAGQLKTHGVTVDPKTIFGVKDDETGEWLIKPRIRYYSPDNGEKFFDYMSMLRIRLPEKVVEKDGSAYLLFENTNDNRKKVGDKYDKKWFSKHNQFKVPAADGHMQAIALVDSYPAMLPDALDDDDASKAMAIQARMFSDGIKRIRGGMRRKMITIVGVNQLRQKPATMFGCLHGTTQVQFVDGRVFTMKDIVDQRIEGQVWSINEETRAIEARSIIDWHYNGDVEHKDHWMKIVTRCPETGNGQAFVICTPNHEVLTDSGWKRADEVTLTDRMVSKFTSVRRGTVSQFLNAMAVGDSSIVSDSPNSGLMKLQDNLNPDYVQWKMDKLEPFFTFDSYSASHNGECYIARGSDFVAYSKHVPEREPWKVKFDDMSFAVFYMDDGTLHAGSSARFSVKRFKGNAKALAKIAQMWQEHGFTVNHSHDDGCFWLTKEDSIEFFERIRKYVPDCMQYKLPTEHQGFYKEFELTGEEHQRPVYVEVIRTENGSDRAFRMKGKYDISVEHNHNYMVGNSKNGIVVHNSPEYEPCGDALKFYCFAEDTLIRTDCGLMTAPQMMNVIDQGGSFEIETLNGFSPVAKVWRVEDAPYPILIDASGHTYTGSAQHRQLVFVADTTDKNESVMRTEWLTLEKMATEDRPYFAAMRFASLEELQQNCPDDYDEARALILSLLLSVAQISTRSISIGTTLDGRVLEEKGTVVSFRDVSTNLVVRAFSNIGIIALAQEESVLIPALDATELGTIVSNGITPEQSSMQRSLMMQLAIMDSMPELARFITDFNQNIFPNAPVYLDDNERLAFVLDEIRMHEYVFNEYAAAYDAIQFQLAYVEDFYQFCGNMVPVSCSLRVLEKPTVFYDVNVPETSVVITNGFVSHNSDVRVRLASRAVPEGWTKLKDAPGIVGEDSVTVEGGTDRYRFIAGKTIKNKMGGIPNQQTWFRLWESDGDGVARGFDPVFDTWHYMKTIGLVTGPRKKIKFLKPCPLASEKAVDWQEFRTLINGDKKQITDICKKLGVKPQGLRLWCFKFLRSAQGKERLKASISRSAKKAQQEDDE